MTRSFTVTAYLAVLITWVFFRIPVLGYCGCSEEFYLASCNCENTPACQLCEEADPPPCPECPEKPFLDLEDFQWDSLSIKESRETTLIPNSPEYPPSLPLFETRTDWPTTQPIPPPKAVPLYLRNQNFRL